MNAHHRFYVAGMYCNACIVLTESELGDVPGVTSVRASLRDNSVDVVGDFGNRSLQEIALQLAPALAPHGYTRSIERPMHQVAWREFVWGAPVAVALVAGFLALQKAGVLNWVTLEEVGYGTAFIVGLVASVSTCMAVVGAIVLSLSATYAKEGNPVRPQVLFHVGRLVSFFLLGGVVGAIGAVFRFGPTGMLVLGIAIGIMLVVLGINLLDVAPWTRRLRLTRYPPPLARACTGYKV